MARTPNKVDPAKQPKVRTTVHIDAELYNQMIDIAERNKDALSGPQTVSQVCEASIKEYLKNSELTETPSSVKRGYRQFGD
jgi:hypothetical protein